MKYPYSLNWYDRLLAGNAPLGDVTELLIPTWRRTKRRVGDCWLGTAEVRAARSDLDDLFQDGLLREIRESCFGELTWRGATVLIEYKRGRDVFVRDATRLINATRARYTRISDSLLTNGSGEAGAWAAYNSATVTQDSTWKTHGTYSVKIVVTEATVRGATIQAVIAITAGKVYRIKGALKVTAGSWRVSANRADNDQSLAFFSTRGKSGDFSVDIGIDAVNTYTGNVDLRITSEGASGTIYADGFSFTEAAEAAETGWFADDESIEEYGRSEYIAQLDDRRMADANAECAGLLVERAWPTTIPPRSGSTALSADPGEDVITLTYAGYWAMLNRRYSTLAGTKTKGEWVSALAALQTEYITAGIIDANADPFTLDDEAQPLGDVLQSIADARSSNGDLYALGVDAARRLNYEHIETALSYVLNATGLTSVTREEIEPALTQPGWALWEDLPAALPRVVSHARTNPNWVFLEEVELLPPTEANPDGVIAFNLD